MEYVHVFSLIPPVSGLTKQAIATVLFEAFQRVGPDHTGQIIQTASSPVLHIGKLDPLELWDKRVAYDVLVAPGYVQAFMVMFHLVDLGSYNYGDAVIQAQGTVRTPHAAPGNYPMGGKPPKRPR